MPNINTKTFVDIHTTGQRREFSSLRKYDEFLKANHSFVVSKNEAKKLIEPRKEKKMDERELKDLAERAWAERGKYIPEIKKRLWEEKNRRK